MSNDFKHFQTNEKTIFQRLMVDECGKRESGIFDNSIFLRRRKLKNTEIKCVRFERFQYNAINKIGEKYLYLCY